MTAVGFYFDNETTGFRFPVESTNVFLDCSCWPDPIKSLRDAYLADRIDVFEFVARVDVA